MLLAVSVIMGNVRENAKKKMNVGIIRKLEKDRAALVTLENKQRYPFLKWEINLETQDVRLG